VLAKSYVFTKQSSFLIHANSLLLLVALQSHFAEFLKGSSSLTFVFSTCSLVSAWYSLSSLQLFPIPSVFSPHHSFLLRLLHLGAVSLLLELPVSYLFPLSRSSTPYVLPSDVPYSSLLILASSLSFLYESFCYLFMPCFGVMLCHLHSRRTVCLLMHCYVFFFAGWFQAYFLDVSPTALPYTLSISSCP